MNLKKLLNKDKKPKKAKKYIMIIDGKTYIISGLKPVSCKFDNDRTVIEGEKITFTTEDLE